MSLYGLTVRSAARVVRDCRRWEAVGELSGPIVVAARTAAIQHSREARFLLESHPEVGEWITLEAGHVQLRDAQ